MASLISPDDRSLWFRCLAHSLFTSERYRHVAVLVKLFDAQGQMRLYLHEASQVQVQGEVSLHKAKGGVSPSFFRVFLGGGCSWGWSVCMVLCERFGVLGTVLVSSGYGLLGREERGREGGRVAPLGREGGLGF